MYDVHAEAGLVVWCVIHSSTCTTSQTSSPLSQVTVWEPHRAHARLSVPGASCCGSVHTEVLVRKFDCDRKGRLHHSEERALRFR